MVNLILLFQKETINLVKVIQITFTKSFYKKTFIRYAKSQGKYYGIVIMDGKNITPKWIGNKIYGVRELKCCVSQRDLLARADKYNKWT